MKKIISIAILLAGFLSACLKIKNDDDPIIPDNHGTLEFRFMLPEYKVPKGSIHRVSLGFALSVDSLYRGQYFQKVNVSDYQESYSLLFLPDEYYYNAVITCSCGGDTCLNGGFPGGRFGMKYNFDKFEIENQKTTIIETHFQ